MKINLKLPAIVLGLMLLFAGTTVKAQDDQVSLQQFYDELSPYGTWIQDPDYGYVWRPDVDQSDFRPYYTNGRWVMTEYGNTWVSNYDWGWAPFHYGRWVYNRYNHWIWLPDTTWGPAWVDWRSGNGYYGWAPMAPLISINIGRRYVRTDFYWNFIPQRNIYYTSFPRYRSYNNYRIINRTTIINNTYVYNNRTYYTGPRPEEIRRATNQDVRVYSVARNNRADAPRVDGNKVNVYTPRPSRTEVRSGTPAPKVVGTYNGNGRVTTDRRGEQGIRRDDNTGRNTNPPVLDRRTGATQERREDRTPQVDRQALPQRQERGEDRQQFPQRNQQMDRQAPPQRQERQQERPPVQQRTQQAPPQRQERQQERPQMQQRQQQAPPQRQERQQERPQVQQQQRTQQAPPARNEQGGGRPGRG